MVNNSVIKLEDGNDYVVVDKIALEEKAYVFLTNVKDMEDFCVRKEVTEIQIDENKMEVEMKYLDVITEEEYEEAMKMFIEKNKA